MQKGGVAFPVRPAGHLGSGAWAALALAAAVADAEGAGALAEGSAAALLAAGADADGVAAVPLASSLSQATSASKKVVKIVVRMRRGYAPATGRSLPGPRLPRPTGRPGVVAPAASGPP